MDAGEDLAAVWEMVLSQLSRGAEVLQMILSFLGPNGIYESVLKNGALLSNNPALRFMLEEIEQVRGISWINTTNFNIAFWMPRRNSSKDPSYSSPVKAELFICLRLFNEL